MVVKFTCPWRTLLRSRWSRFCQSPNRCSRCVGRKLLVRCLWGSPWLYPATALTPLSYAGEQFDVRIGQRYLQARWYNPTIGRCNLQQRELKKHILDTSSLEDTIALVVAETSTLGIAILFHRCEMIIMNSIEKIYDVKERQPEIRIFREIDGMFKTLLSGPYILCTNEGDTLRVGLGEIIGKVISSGEANIVSPFSMLSGDCSTKADHVVCTFSMLSCYKMCAKMDTISISPLSDLFHEYMTNGWKNVF